MVRGSQIHSRAVAEVLAGIRIADRSFDLRDFLQGALMAYEIILAAFAKGNTFVLADLTSAEVYGPFVKAIAEQEIQSEWHDLTLLKIVAATIIEAATEGRTALITVRFSSLFVRSGGHGDIAADDSEKSIYLTDEWTFERELRSRNPNWKLIATRSGSAS
jgi:predicted lipid-binding transport protein (Tim44 family)